MIKSNLFQMDDFSGGLNTATSTKGISINQSPNCLNVHSNLYKSLEARKGCTAVSSAATSELTGRGSFIYPYWYGNTLRYQLISFWQDKMYMMENLNGTYTSITLGSAQFNDTYEGTVYSTYGTNYFIFTNHALTTPQVYTGGTTTTSLNTATMESCKFVLAWKNHLFCAYTKESGTIFPYRLRRTNTGTYGSGATDWTASVAGYDDIVTSDGDYITALRGLRNYMYVFKRNSIFRVAYLGGSPLVEIKQMASVGSDAPQTIKNVTLLNGDEILIFLGTDNKLYLFDGYNNPQSISELIFDDNKISQYSIPKINKTVREYACAANYSRRHWYVIGFAVGSSSNNAGYIIDYYSAPFSIFPIKGWNASCYINAEDSLGVRNLYFQEYDGKLYQADIGNSDAGTSIEAYWESSKIKTDKFPSLKKAQQVQTIVETKGNYTINFRYRTDDFIPWNSTTINQKGEGGDLLGSTFILGTSKLGTTEDTIDTIDIPQLFNFIQFKIDDTSSNPKMNLYRIDLLGAPSREAGMVTKT